MALQVSALGDAVCQSCAAEYQGGKRRCPACGELNPIEGESCARCQEPLTVLETVLARQKAGLSSYRLEKMRALAPDLKEQGNRHSAVRMAEFTAVDQRRMDADREAMFTQQARDLMLLRNVKIGFGIFLVLIAIISLVVLL
jgi:predicted amidophosphoribosyltransferase